jgi:predicted nucleic acid-binding protein
VIVRYITGLPTHQLPAAIAVIEGEENLIVTDVAIAETAFVARSLYQVEREAILDALIGLLRRKNMDVFRLEKKTVIDALGLCRPSNRVSVADALIWAAARSAEEGSVYTFDARFPSVDIERRRLR